MLFCRFNRTLKLKLSRFMTHNNTKRWCDDLQDMVTSYNETQHRTIKMRPVDVQPGLTEELAWRNQYEEGPAPPEEEGDFRFKVGDTVRLSHVAKAFKREYGQRWTLEVFRIDARQRRGPFNIYSLKDLQDEAVLGTWYEKELQGVSVDVSGNFVVDHVVRTRRMRGQKQFLIRWRGYPAKFDSWISADDFVPVDKS